MSLDFHPGLDCLSPVSRTADFGPRTADRGLTVQ